jgi:integrase
MVQKIAPDCFPSTSQNGRTMKLKLDQHTVNTRTLAKGESEEFIWDTELENFGLRLRRSARGVRRTYVVQYRVHGRTRRQTLGSKLSLQQARQVARRALAKVMLGHDPQAEKSAKRAQAARTFAAAVKLYLAAAETHLRPGSLRGIRLYLTGPYFRPLHSAPLGELARADIAARLTAIAREHSPGVAAAARRAVSALFAWAIEEGWIESNPVLGTRKPAAPTSRDRVLSNNELVAIWRACGDDDYGRIIRLSILLGARRQEIGGMKWDEYNPATGVWVLPGVRSKNHRPHTIALPPAAQEILATVERNGREFLFGGKRSAGFVTWSRHKAQLDQRLGDRVAPWHVHDLRRTAATRMADLGVEPHVIEAALNHYSGHKRGIAGVYNRSPYERAVAIALTRWSEHVLALVEGRESNVVNLVLA